MIYKGDAAACRAMPFKQRKKDQPHRTNQQWKAQRRFGELMRLMHRYYPNGLPHNGAGYKFAKYVCRTLAFDPIDRRAEWLNRNALWLDGADRSRLLSYGPYCSTANGHSAIIAGFRY